MKTFISYLLLYIVLSTGIAKSQVSTKDTPQVLEDLFDRLVDNYNDSDRIRINDSIRIILENEPGRYFCYFIIKQDPGGENMIYRLSASYNDDPVRTDTTYSEPNWYGALYYDLKPCIIDNRRCWVLLGIDYGNFFISRKIIEVLNFSTDNSIIFGRKWFASGEELKYREVFEYASNAMMSLRFRSDSSIIFDHLVPFSDSHKNDRQYYGPDYSFDEHSFENGIWKLTMNVDARNKE